MMIRSVSYVPQSCREDSRLELGLMMGLKLGEPEQHTRNLGYPGDPGQPWIRNLRSHVPTWLCLHCNGAAAVEPPAIRRQ